MDKYYTPEQVAEILLVQPRTVRSWLRDGDLLGDKVSNQWRISHKNLQEFKSKNSKEEQFSILELVKILNVEESIITTWVISGKLKGTKVENSRRATDNLRGGKAFSASPSTSTAWRITKSDLEEAFPETDFIASEFFPEEEMDEKLVSQIPDSDKVFKALYPEEYEKHHEYERNRQSSDTALTRYYNQCQEDLERRFPYSLSEEVVDNPLLHIWSFYESKYKEESMKLDRLTSKLKEKYGVPAEDIAELKRTHENLQLLKIGTVLHDVSHL
jgi:excisionase family DNA binding protein